MDAFQPAIPQDHRRLRLAETIAWCSFKPLENSPEESEDIKHRRQLAARASAILRTTYQPDSKSWFSWLTGRKKRLLRDEAFRLLREAAPDSIEPLKDQLRTQALKSDGKFDSRQTETERAAIVESLCQKRSVLVRESGKNTDSKEINLANGRVLLYVPDDKPL